MNQIKQEVYETFEELSKNKEEKKEIRDLKNKKRIEDILHNYKQTYWVAIVTTILSVIFLGAESPGSDPTTKVIMLTIIIIGVWGFHMYQKQKLNDARIDYYHGTEIIKEIREEQE